ncbi:universal stress protein [Streptomyces sp. NPDC008238]
MEEPSQQRVVVGVSGSLNSLVALQRAGAEARLSRRRLLAVLVWTRAEAGLLSRGPGPEVPVAGNAFGPAFGPTFGHAFGRGPGSAARSAATRLLTAMLNDVFAATADDLHIDGLAISGRHPGETLVKIAQRDDDLLVVGAGRRRPFGWARSRVARHCLVHASCPVLTVPPSPLQLDLEAMTRRRGLRRYGRDEVRQELLRALTGERLAHGDL